MLRFTTLLDLKTTRLYRSGNKDAASNEFHSFTVRIMNVKAKRFKRTAAVAAFHLLPLILSREMDTYVNLHTMDLQFINNKCSNCPRIYVPICGTDNKTYTNECKLRCVNRYRKEKYVVKRYGPCMLGYRRNDEFDFESNDYKIDDNDNFFQKFNATFKKELLSNHSDNLKTPEQAAFGMSQLDIS